ncbi:MAG: polysaccharide pyruvyl transferase family protein [Acetatifactor sp.]|nr:polysaccharide pyruvyl transferase family protein [Acetatifactor sp.]
MKKVAILTITNSGLNFGNRLQNYALQKSLEQYADRVETIVSAKSWGNSAILSGCRRLLKRVLRSDDRRRCFSSFDRQYITMAKRIRYEGVNEHKFAAEYDAFVAGSDQVWNPNFSFNSGFEFADFAPASKRFSYAASFGVDEIPKEDREKYIEYLSRMMMLSVRENTGVKLIRELTGREAVLSIDPTMLLGGRDYIPLEKRPKNIEVPKHYVLKYYLGSVPQEYEEDICEIGETLGVPVEYLSESRGTRYYSIGPSEFLYMFRHADYVCTDSFHGTVFSILFHKRFTVYVRRDNEVPMNDRLKTLLSMVGLTGRVYGELSLSDRMKGIDYQTVDDILEKKRKESAEYFLNMQKVWNDGAEE